MAEASSAVDVFLFTSVLGPDFMPERLPRTARFFGRVYRSALPYLESTKDCWSRPRPFVVDPTLAPLERSLASTRSRRVPGNVAHCRESARTPADSPCTTPPRGSSVQPLLSQWPRHGRRNDGHTARGDGSRAARRRCSREAGNMAMRAWSAACTFHQTSRPDVSSAPCWSACWNRTHTFVPISMPQGRSCGQHSDIPDPLAQSSASRMGVSSSDSCRLRFAARLSVATSVM